MFVLYTLSQYNVKFGVVGDEAIEEISVDESENVVECHVTETSPRRNDAQVWTVTDFSRVSTTVTVCNQGESSAGI